MLDAISKNRSIFYALPMVWGQLLVLSCGLTFYCQPAMSGQKETEYVSWRNADFFNDVIAEDFKVTTKDFSITGLHISTAVPKTAGYVSLIHRVLLQVDFSDSCLRKQVSYIIKEKRSPGEGIEEVVDEINTYRKETEFYNVILPAFEKIWEHQSLKFGPRILKTTTVPFKVIVMEDLKSSGFKAKKCDVGLLLPDCEKVLEKLAKFHAASVFHYEKTGSYSDHFMGGPLSERLLKPFEIYYTPLFDSFLQILDDLKYHPKLLEALQPLKGKVFTITSNLFRFDPKKFNVLNHGDLRIASIHIREYDKLFLNYQSSFYGTPAFDLLYFLTMSASFSTRIDKFDHLIDHYYMHLKLALQKLGTKTGIPTQRKLRDDITAHGFLMCLKSIETLAISLGMPKLEIDMKLLRSTGPDGNEFRRNLYANVQFEKTLERFVMFMWKKGFFSVS